MLYFNRSNHIVIHEIGEVKVQVKLTNTVDEILVERRLLNHNQLCSWKTQALVYTSTVRTPVLTL
ncbi:hypothetical protein [Scytonema sp. NUACC26]|uniref:hypothetical protein n=1 Tax=Scytonema sp. NUACC26 TaxID=3140176 RepID=UPI0034DBB624